MNYYDFDEKDICIIKSGYLGTKTPYYFEPTIYTKAPYGYKPIYINHLGRHGARYLSNEDEIDKIYKVILDAENKRQLTKEEYVLKLKLNILKKIQDGKYNTLTKSGYEMEAGIAKRMYGKFPNVFGKKVLALCTDTERTEQSMEAFLQELSQYTSKINFVKCKSEILDPVLRFYKVNTAYSEYNKSKVWEKEVDEYTKRCEVAQKTLRPFFTSKYLNGLENAYKVALDLYELHCNEFNTKEFVDLGEYFNICDLRYYWENNNLDKYFGTGPYQNLSIQISFILLADFLDKTQQALRCSNTSVDLRFAHAETIIPFVGFLGLKEASIKAIDKENVKYIWNDYKISPMAANIQWIFYKKDNNSDILMKVLYNEKEVMLPIFSDIKPYYRWQEVECYYVKKINSLNLDWNQSLVDLVKNFKSV